MGQAEVIDFLKKCNKPVTRKDIADGIGFDPIRVSHIIKKLLRWGDIKFVEYSQEEAKKLVEYKLQRRTKFYFLEE